MADIEKEKPSEAPPEPKSSPRKKRDSKGRKKKASSKPTSGQKRTTRPYPAASFEDTLPLALAIHKVAAGDRVRRLTLLKEMDRAPNAESTKALITNSGKYGITKGSYVAEWLELTEQGRAASDLALPTPQRLQAQFDLAIAGVEPFKRIYDEYRGKKLPAHEVLKDLLRDSKYPIDDFQATVDLFVVNAKYLGLLQTIASSEVIVSIEQVIEERTKEFDGHLSLVPLARSSVATHEIPPTSSAGKIDWSRICFYITPIGAEDSEERQHSDLFLSSLIEPALKEFGLTVVRADKIGAPGMITSQILEHTVRSRLAIVDMSFHNPNAFYEMAIRHATGLPVVQICRKANALPFDVNQVRTVVIDTTGIYSLVPRLETYRSEIATQVRTALANPTAGSNPITLFFPGLQITLPKEK